jgi:hypothetical protein
LQRISFFDLFEEFSPELKPPPKGWKVVRTSLRGRTSRIHVKRSLAMEELQSITVSEERLEDCRDVVELDLQLLIRETIDSGFSVEEVLIAISELVAEDFAHAVKVASVH